MKTKSCFFMIGIFCIALMAKANEPDYIITGEKVNYYEKVRQSLTSGLVGVEESGKVKYHPSEVVAFRKKGHVYERMPVIVNNKETGKHEFMELIAYRGGLKVYRHSIYTGRNMTLNDEYLVFCNGCYHVCFDENNSKTLCEFFFR